MRHDVTDPVPKVSFGLPVYNGEASIRRAMDSLLAQDLNDIEVVVSDNASEDRTYEILQEYAQRDCRVRLFRNDQNQGQINNFNRVLDLSRGTYYRWIGANDWLEPDYASSCVAELEAHLNAVAVSTGQDFETDTGVIPGAEYEGEHLESERPERRFQRMLWFLKADYRFIDPIYSMIRRDALLRTRRLLFVWDNDHLLALEMALQGPWRHIPRVLGHRYREPSYYASSDRLRKIYNPAEPRRLDWSAWRMGREMYAAVSRQRLTPQQTFHCTCSIVRHLAKEEVWRASCWAWDGLRPWVPERLRAWAKKKLGRNEAESHTP
jgi:glycosyltransferase involved in cell wall biosynthesis